jgi:hypothetical protein
MIKKKKVFFNAPLPPIDKNYFNIRGLQKVSKFTIF